MADHRAQLSSGRLALPDARGHDHLLGPIQVTFVTRIDSSGKTIATLRNVSSVRLLEVDP